MTNNVAMVSTINKATIYLHELHMQIQMTHTIDKMQLSIKYITLSIYLYELSFYIVISPSNISLIYILFPAP